MKEISQKDEVVNSEKFFMKNTIEKMVEQGKLTREEADKIIRELNDNNS
jgi:polyhydroxyalkanoate synthesis regulator phasin